MSNNHKVRKIFAFFPEVLILLKRFNLIMRKYLKVIQYFNTKIQYINF